MLSQGHETCASHDTYKWIYALFAFKLLTDVDRICHKGFKKFELWSLQCFNRNYGLLGLAAVGRRRDFHTFSLTNLQGSHVVRTQAKIIIGPNTSDLKLALLKVLIMLSTCSYLRIFVGRGSKIVL